MRILAAISGLGLLLLVLVDTFNTIVLARRTQHTFRLTRLFYQATYPPYRAIARRIRSG